MASLIKRNKINYLQWVPVRRDTGLIPPHGARVFDYAAVSG